MRHKIVLLATRTEFTNAIFNRLMLDFKFVFVIIEKKQSKKSIIRRRIQRLGLFKVFGQILFLFFITRMLFVFSKGRIKTIHYEFGLDFTPIPLNYTFYVENINSKEVSEIFLKWK